MSEVAPPEADPYEAASGPPGTCFFEIRRFAQLDSTNRYLLDVARRRPRHGLVAVADHQRAGRGRLGRRWEAPPGANLLVSVLLVSDLRPDELHLCNVAASLAVSDACRRAASLESELKWPNDLLVGGRKLAGILAESVPASAPATGLRVPVTTTAVVVGIGLNVRWPPPEGDPEEARVPEELRTSATSIRRETGQELDPPALLPVLLVAIDEHVTELADPQGRVRLFAQYRRRCATLGQEVRVALAEGEVRGRALDITPEGHLVIDSATGPVTVAAGDVVHLRER